MKPGAHVRCSTNLGAGEAYATKYKYDDNRRITRITDPTGKYVKNSYDANGWLTVVEKFKPASPLDVRLETRKTDYRPDGKVWKTFNPECFNSAGNEITNPTDCTTITNTYDILGRLETVTDGANRVVRTEYDLNGQVLKKISADHDPKLRQDTATYTYSDNGQRASVMDANGNRTEFFYDGHDRLDEVQYPNKTKVCSAATPCDVNHPNGPASVDPDHEKFGYDKNDNQTWRLTRAGDCIVQEFDALDRQITHEVHLNCQNSNIQRDVATAYDPAGRVLTVTDTAQSPSVQIGYHYDSAGRKDSETQNDGVARTIIYDLDPVGNTIGITWPDSPALTVAYGYDALNRLRTINGSGSVSVGYDYDDLSRRSAATYANGRTASYEYFADSTLKQVLHPNLIDTNADGVGDADGVWDFTYTPANQVKSKALPEAFLWQATGSQIGVKTYVSNGLNQYSSVSAVPFSYDTKGNLTGDGIWTYAYDGENRLMTASRTQGIAVDASYVYDGLDRRIAKTVVKNGTTTTRYLWAGQNIIAEYTNEGTLLRRYIHGAKVDEPLVEVNYSPTVGTYYYHADHEGTIVTRTNSAGAIEANDAYKYSPFGEPSVTEGSIWRFTGRQLDAETSLYYYRARMYHPALGRFMQTDPAGDKDSPNLYQYALWDPIAQKDATGNEVTAVYDGHMLSMKDNDDPDGGVLNMRADSGKHGFTSLYGGTIEPGMYYILQHPGRDKSKPWYRLERVDDHFGDDKTPTGRDELRLHGPGNTIGCIAICESSDAVNVDRMLSNTKTTTVTTDNLSRKKRYFGIGPETETVKKYGTLEVKPKAPAQSGGVDFQMHGMTANTSTIRPSRGKLPCDIFSEALGKC